jgi:hypothetical protein
MISDNDKVKTLREKYNIGMGEIAAGGTLAISLVLLQDLVSLNTADPAALTATFAFAIAIPLLAFTFSRNYLRKLTGKNFTLYEGLLSMFGFFSAVVGIGASIWHISWIAGVIFVVSAVTAYISFDRSPIPPRSSENQ